MENKIIFLDIDGPVIPVNAGMYNSMYRTTHDRTAITLLIRLCEETGAKIVTNTFHNEIWYQDGDLKSDLIKWGLKPEYFHEDWQTIFPNINYKQLNSPVRGIGRLHAINQWLVAHEVDKWVCFDDRLFTDLPNLIHIKGGMGIRQTHYEQALEILGKK